MFPTGVDGVEDDDGVEDGIPIEGKEGFKEGGSLRRESKSIEALGAEGVNFSEGSGEGIRGIGFGAACVSGLGGGITGGLKGGGVGASLGASILGPPAPNRPKGSSSKPLPLKLRGDPPKAPAGDGVAAGAFDAALFFRQSWQTGFPVSTSRHSSQ